MKDFNIEQLAKKTPYKIPENTFEEMQENVFNKTVRKKDFAFFSPPRHFDDIKT